MSDPLALPSLTVRYENSRPVELADLTASLTAVARRFSRFVAQTDIDLDETAMKLYVREIRPGSIIVDLVNTVAAHADLVGAGLTLAGAVTKEQAEAVVEFAKNLREGLQSLLGGEATPGDPRPASELSDLAKIVEPVAKDSRGNINITANDGASVQVSITYNSLEANTIQNRAEREIEGRREPIQKQFKRVLMYWHQASRTPGSRSDKASIDSIWDKPLKVVFDEADHEIKTRMIAGKENPFTIGFLVDVELLTVRGRPAAYKVTHLYEVLDSDEADGDDAG